MFSATIGLIVLCSISVDCALYSLNNKYSNRYKLHSYHSVERDTFQSNLKPGFGSFDIAGIINTKTKAATYTNKVYRSKRNADPEILKDRVVLNGTERSTQAYIHWVGKGTSETIFVLTRPLDYRSRATEGQLWRSDDYGSSFKEMKLESGAHISNIYPFSTNSKKLILADVLAKKLYTLDDNLKVNKSYSVPVEPDIILPHPIDENKFLLYSLTQRKLYVSVNFGANVTLLAEDVLPNFSWAENGYDQNMDMVHMEVKGGMPLQALYKSCLVPDCKVTPDSELSEVGPFIAGSLIVHKEYMFVQKSNWNGSDNYLAVSYQRKAFKRAYFPGDLKKTNDFILLNLDNGQVFVAVNHGDHVNLYLSDVTGQYYTLSLDNISHTISLSWFEVDFYEVEGMNWTFIVNKRVSAQPGITFKTYISYDKGGNWAPLVVNQTCKKGEECGLRLLQSSYSLLNTIYSDRNAVGVILAHGFVGNTSSNQPSVFTTNDGGANWNQALVEKNPLTGILRFNIMDQGSILTAIPDGLLSGSNTSIVYYSLDQGLSWTSQQFDKQNLIVKGVLTEPGITTMVESVFGHEGKDKSWTLIKLNFSLLLQKKCEDKDYIDWTPKDYNSVNASTCLLGSVTVYKRRNFSTRCYNGESFKAKKENVSCPCTPEDYECDFGYEQIGDICNKSKWFDDNYLPSECEVNDTYHETNGYRKIPTDSCVESNINVKTDKKIVNCPTIAPSNLSIIFEAIKIQAGKEIRFHLEQAGGSTRNTNYTWNFGDESPIEKSIGLKNSSPKKHIFQKSGHYSVSVTAENVKGKTTAVANVHVQEPIINTYIAAPWAGIIKKPVTISTVVVSHTRLLDANNDHMHFIWSFGDEQPGSLPLLTWNNTFSHTYNTSGLFKVTVEAVNSITSVYREILIQIFDKAEILLLKFSDNVSAVSVYLNEPLMGLLFTQRLRQQLAEDTGVNLNRFEAAIASTEPLSAYLYIFQSTDEGELNMTQLKTFVMDKVSKGVLGFSIMGRSFDADNVIKIVSATDLSSTDDSQSTDKGVNLKPILIAAPILVLVIIVSVGSLFYCRKKMTNIRQYNLLNNHDDSDAMLDDDEAPLDLNVDFGVREGSQDDSMIDSRGGSHLVLVTGSSSDNAINC